MSSNLAQLKNDFITAAARSYNKSIQLGNGGNISARVPGRPHMLIKPREISLIDCTPDNLIVTDFEGNLIEGNGLPTKEAYLHGMLYKLLPDIGGIVHCHSPWAVAWSLEGQDIPLLTQHARLKLSSPIPVLPVDSPVVGPEHFPDIEQKLRQDTRLEAFVLAAHGSVAWGKSVIAAEHNAQLVEECAQIACLRRMMK